MSDIWLNTSDDLFIDTADDLFISLDDVDTPVIFPVSGPYYSSQFISMSTGTAGASIYYTEDGSTPDATDTLYTVPFALVSAKTIKAIGIKAGLDDSGIATEVYTILSVQPIITIMT